MRKVKASTILFSEDEPVVAVQMRDMKKEICDLKEAQQTLFKIIDERLPERDPKSVTSATSTFAGIVQKHIPGSGNPTLTVTKPYERDGMQPPKKRINSVHDDNDSDTMDDLSLIHI